jgi:phosphate-selective porin OprO and OprP
MRKILLGLSSILLTSAAFADVTVDVLGDDEVIFEGLFQADANYFTNDFNRADGLTLTPAQRTTSTFIDQRTMRRAELNFRGKDMTNDWAVGYDAKGGRWLDVFYRHKFTGFNTIRVGQFKQPNSLEELTSTKHNDFVAKAMTTSAFAMARRIGAELATGDVNWTGTLSGFTREITQAGQAAEGYGARLTYAPLMQISETVSGEAEHVLHLGVSAISFDPARNTQRVNVRPEADLATIRLIDSTNLTDTQSARQIGLEAAYFNGPLKIMAEYVDAQYGRKNNPDYSPDSWYVSGVYNLSGERFGYTGGIYTVPLPKETAGMWQLTGRYSKLNANDGRVLGGEQETLTLGVNWYWRLNFKFMANYNQTRGARNGINNDPSVVELRAQVML